MRGAGTCITISLNSLYHHDETLHSRSLIGQHTPVQVLYGLIVALGACLICSLTRFWNNGFKRTTAVFFCGLAIMWLGLKFSYLGASSVGCLSLTVLTSLFWERGWPPGFCKGAKPLPFLCFNSIFPHTSRPYAAG